MSLHRASFSPSCLSFSPSHHHLLQLPPWHGALYWEARVGEGQGTACNIKLEHWPKAPSYRGFEPGGREGEGVPMCSSSSSSLAACLVSGSSGPQKESYPLASGLLSKNLGTLCGTLQYCHFVPLRGNRAAFYTFFTPGWDLPASSCSSLPLWMGTDIGSCCLGIYQRKQMPWALIFSLLPFLCWLHVSLGNFPGCPGLCT